MTDTLNIKPLRDGYAPCTDDDLLPFKHFTNGWVYIRSHQLPDLRKTAALHGWKVITHGAL